MLRSPLASPPQTLSLLPATAKARPPPLPFGLVSWSDADADAVAIVLDAPDSVAAGDAAFVAAQIPEASSMRPGTLVVVLGDARESGGRISRLFRRSATFARSVRCTALLARGYTHLGAGLDKTSRADLAWGYA